jgi:hypothetical protein
LSPPAALYFFHQQTRNDIIEDPEGGEFASLASARSAAIEAARQLLAAALVKGGSPAGIAFRIADQEGQVLLHIPFRDALPPGFCEPAEHAGP